MSKNNNVLDSNADAEFRQLFWKAREEQARLGTKATDNDPFFVEAMAYAHTQAWEWGQSLLWASFHTWIEEPDKALTLLDECASSIPNTWQGILLHLRGHALYAKGEHDAAIEAYYKALEDPNYDKHSNTWSSLGIALKAKGDYDAAIEAYHKVLGDPNYDKHGNAWHNLGNALYAKEDYDAAIEAYRKALEDPDYERQAATWNNIGLVLIKKGKYREAIEAHRTVMVQRECPFWVL